MKSLCGINQINARLSTPLPSRNALITKRPTNHTTRIHATTLPDFLPQPQTSEIEEPAAIQLLQRIQRISLNVPTLGNVETTFVGPETKSTDRPAFVMLHGFDSSCLEFRRFVPVLSSIADVYAVDLAGWGFSDCGFGENPKIPLGPQQKREHLKTFIEQVIGRKVILLGASLGGTVAIDFTITNPELVDRLVLADAQGFIDGIGPLASMPRFLSVLGVKVLRSVALRQMANQMAYYNKEKYATDDAMRIGRLHTFAEGWTDANVAFMRSGGYAVSTKLNQVNVPTLVVWGRNDEILSPEYADKFLAVLPDARLRWIEDCGHVPALEQPQAFLVAIQEFLEETGGVVCSGSKVESSSGR